MRLLADQGGRLTQDSIDFQRRISLKNGVSDSSACPVGFRQDPVTLGLEPAREEAKMVLFGAIREVLARTGRDLPRLPDLDTSACSSKGDQDSGLLNDNPSCLQHGECHPTQLLMVVKVQAYALLR